MSIRLLPGFIREVQKRIPSETNRITIEVAKVIHATAVRGTPVDTSKALSNWQVKLGSRPTGNIKAYVEGKAGSTRGASQAEAINQAETELKGRKFGQEIHIANNLPYIKKLDAGNYSQQPGNFVAAAVAAGRAKVKSATIRI